MVLKQAALAPEGKSSKEASILSISVGAPTAEKFVLCHLTPGKCEQWAIDLGFGPEEEVYFHLSGNCPVHLTGFYEMEEEDEDGFEGEMDDDDDDEDGEEDDEDEDEDDDDDDDDEAEEEDGAEEDGEDEGEAGDDDDGEGEEEGSKAKKRKL